MEPPVAEAAAGQASVTAMAGAVVTPQVDRKVLATTTEVQMSRPVACRLALTEQTLAGTV